MVKVVVNETPATAPYTGCWLFGVPSPIEEPAVPTGVRNHWYYPEDWGLNVVWEMVKFIQPLTPGLGSHWLDVLFHTFQDGLDSLRKILGDKWWPWLSLTYLYDITDWINQGHWVRMKGPWAAFLRWTKFSYFWSCEESQLKVSLNFPELWYPMESWHHDWKS